MTTSDYKWMRRAFQQACRGRGKTAPNPMVGCVLVKKNHLLATGYHQAAGKEHAEAVALQQAGAAAQGATLYVTLEPCAHQGRTPPCTTALIAAGITRVVIAMQDPNPQVNGRGIAVLRQAGIAVTLGPMAQECYRLNESFCYAIVQQQVFVVAKIAQSLDGRNRSSGGQSRWITGKKARNFGHQLRGRLDGIMVGSGTVAADDPSLTCRVQTGRDPVRIVVDTHAQTLPQAKVIRIARYSSAPTWICVGTNADQARLQILQAAGAHIVLCPEQAGHLNLSALCRLLFVRGLCSILVEGGSRLLAGLFASQLVQQAHIITAPIILNGNGENTSLQGPGCQTLTEAVRLVAIKTRRLGRDRLLSGRVRYPARAI